MKVCYYIFYSYNSFIRLMCLLLGSAEWQKIISKLIYFLFGVARFVIPRSKLEKL